MRHWVLGSAFLSMACLANPCSRPVGAFMTRVHWPELQVAAIQFKVLGDQSFDGFLGRVRGWVERAKAEGAQLVVFPELHSLDLLQNSAVSDRDQLRQIASEHFDAYRRAVEALSRELDIAILAGTFPRLQGEQVFNTSVLSFADGRSVLQDKLFLTPDEKLWGWSAGDALRVVDTPWGPSATLICFDCEIPRLSDNLVPVQPDLILVPSMTGPTGFYRVRWSAQSRAVEHHASVVHAGTVGGTRGRTEFFGSAGIILPQDTPYPVGLAAESAPNQEAIVSYRIPLEQIRRRRLAFETVHPAREQRERVRPIQVETITQP
jgi:predicted amidohydrolase